MKVAMLGWELPPFMAGGLGVHCLELTRGLHRRGVEIDFYMPKMGTAEDDLRVGEHHDHARVIEVPADPDVTPYGDRSTSGSGSGGRTYDETFDEAVRLYNQRLLDAFDSPDADLIHCHDWITVPAALELSQREGLPLVFTVHSTEVDRSGGLDPQGWIGEIERAGLHGADKVITVSRYTKDLVQRVYDAPGERIVPVHNGINRSQLHDADERDYDRQRDTVLFLSRLVRQKGPLHFLAAADRVIQERPQTRFIVAGKGPMLPECIGYALENDLTRNVRFTGFVPEDRLADVYAQSGLYVLPSISEPFGISILEAMATGLPTIVSKTTGAGEVLDHVLKADFWDIDEMADMMLGLLQSPALRAEMGSNGGREVHKFSWDDCCRETHDVYRAAVEEHPRTEVKP